MRKTLPLLFTCGFLLSGCGSWVNPVNWFNGASPNADVLTPIEEENPLIPESTSVFETLGPDDVAYAGTPIDTISELVVERIPGGVIIRATGRSQFAVPFNARLVSVSDGEEPDEGVLTYSLRAQYARFTGGAVSAREVTVARQLTDQELGATRTVRVEGVQNALQKRR